MKSSAKKVELASVDDLFSTEESRADAQREKVVEIPLSELHVSPFNRLSARRSVFAFPVPSKSFATRTDLSLFGTGKYSECL